MSNTVAVSVIENGERNVLLHVYLASDGGTGELVETTLLDPATLSMPTGARFRLGRIEYNFSGFDAVIEFDSGAVTPNFKWVLTEGANHPVDFLPWSLIMDDSGLDGTGELQITTTGFTSVGDQGSMLIRLIK